MRPIITPSIGIISSPMLYDEQTRKWIKEGAISFAGGIVSYPRDFAIGAHFIMALCGALTVRDRVKATYELVQVKKTLTILNNNKSNYLRVLSVVYDKYGKGQNSTCEGVERALEALTSEKALQAYAMKISKAAGRFVGGKITKFIVTGGPYGAAANLHPATGIAISMSMLAVTSIGSLVRFVRKNGRSPNEIEAFTTIILGEVEKHDDGSAPDLKGSHIMDLLKEIQKCPGAKTSQAFTQHEMTITEVHKGVEALRCLK